MYLYAVIFMDLLLLIFILSSSDIDCYREEMSSRNVKYVQYMYIQHQRLNYLSFCHSRGIAF